MKGSFQVFKKYSPLLYDLTSRDVKIKYRRSVLGLAWSILNPLLMMIVLTTVFGHLLKIDMSELNFPVYFIIGNSLFSFFSEATTGAMTSVIYGGSLIKKVYIPKYIFPLEKCLFSLVNLLFSMIAVVIVMLFRQVSPSWTMLLFFVPIIYCFVFAVGISLILSALTVYFRDLMHLWSVLLTIWMYLTPIIYPMSLIEDATGLSGQILRTAIQINPMYYFVDYFRSVLMFETVPGLQQNLICFGFGAVFLLIGVLVFRKLQNRFILHI